MAKDDELGGSAARRSKDYGEWSESGAGRFRRDTSEDSIQRDENLPGIRKTEESATGADAVTAIGRNRMRMLERGLVCRCDCGGNPIAQIAMWRIRCKPEQQRAE
jgi:hypothetical protein